MRFYVAVTVLVAAFAAGASRASVSAQAPDKKTVWNGIFTDAQAARGQGVYAQECASCHGPTLDGGEMAPPLAGGGFMSEWDGLTVGDLYDRIRLTMPDGNPGMLSRQQIADIVAHLLAMNKFPAGDAEMSTQSEILKQIGFVANKPK